MLDYDSDKVSAWKIANLGLRVGFLSVSNLEKGCKIELIMV